MVPGTRVLKETMSDMSEYPWVFRKGDHLSIDFDLMPAEMEEATRLWVAEQNGTPCFSGAVDAAYPLTSVKDKTVCPECGGQTVQHTANFIYTTSAGTRVMFAPAGWFCRKCPTVIIDERLLAKSMTAKVKFQRAIGILDAEQDQPHYFSRWRGEKPIYYLDEEEAIIEMRVPSELKSRGPGPAPPRIKAEKMRKKSKRKQTRHARKQNRKRKK